MNEKNMDGNTRKKELKRKSEVSNKYTYQQKNSLGRK